MSSLSRRCSRRVSVAYPSLSRMAPRSLCHTTAVRWGANLPRVDAGLGNVPRPSCPGGLSMDSPSPHVFGRVYGDTTSTIRSYFASGGVAGFFLDGWSCCGLRRPSAEGSGLACAVVPPAHPPTFLETGGLPLYPRRGLRPLHPAWGREGTAFAHLARRDSLPNLPPSIGGRDRGVAPVSAPLSG